MSRRDGPPPAGGRARDIEGLMRFLEERAAMPFAWGANDCVSHAAGAVAAQIGVDPLAGLDWSSEEEARAVLTGEGGMRRALDRRFRRVAPAQAERGDIAGVPCARFGTRLMIVEGDTLVGPGDAGAKRMRRAAMAAAWSVAGFRAPPDPRQPARTPEAAPRQGGGRKKRAAR